MNPLPGQSGAATAQDDTIFRTLAAYADALDALPLDLTRSFSDLRELDAVLGAHLTSLTSRLQHLTAVIEDPDVSPGERLLALRDVAEEARGYKMGGEDKIRVAVTTAETIISHTDYIASLLANLRSVPSLKSHLSPSESQLDSFGNPILDNEYYDLGIGPSSLNHNSHSQSQSHLYPGDNVGLGVGGSSTGGRKRKVGMNDTKGKSNSNSNYNGDGSGNYSGNGTPLLGTGGGQKKRKTATSTGKESTNLSNVKEKEKSRKVNNNQSNSSMNQLSSNIKDNGSNRDRGSYDDGKITRNEPSSSRNSYSHQSIKNGNGIGASGSRGNSRSRDFDHDYIDGPPPVGNVHSVGNGGAGVHQQSYLDNSLVGQNPTGGNHYERDYRINPIDSQSINNNQPLGYQNDSRFNNDGRSNQISYVQEDEHYRRGHVQDSPNHFNNNPSAFRNAPLSGNGGGGGMNSRIPSGNSNSGNGGRGEEDVGDETRYCYCDRVSFGEMMGCDDEDCPKEWFHLECTGYQAPPEGTWYCDICTEKRAKEAARGKGKAKGPYSRKGKR